MGSAGSAWVSVRGDRPAEVLIVAEVAATSAAEAAVQASGCRLLGCVGWREAQERLAQPGALALVLADARGVSDALLEPVLPMLDGIRQSDAVRIVCTLNIEQIDIVTGQLSGPTIDLLCAPSDAELVAALYLASVHNRVGVREEDAETTAAQFRRLQAQVAQIAETLARLTGTSSDFRYAEDRPAGVSEASFAYRGPPSVGSGQDEAQEMTAAEVRAVIRARRLRDKYFGQGLFEDPAWDMLLDLFAAELERGRVSVSSLCIAAAVAPTTALRWIARMTEAGLFERRPDPFDRRRAFLGLSDGTSLAMRSYCAAVRRADGALS